MHIPTVFSAIRKLCSLLTHEEKMTWVKIVGFTFLTSILEVVTASIIVVFAQVINQPEVGLKYLSMIGVDQNKTSSSVVLYVAIIVGITYIIKNIFSAIEVFYQSFSIQKMNYNFKNKLLNRYAESDYSFYLTRNSSFGMQVVGGDVEQMFSVGMVALGVIMSESIVFLCLISMVIFMNPSLAFIVFGLGVVFALVVMKLLLPRFYSWGQRFQQAALLSGQNLVQFFHAFKEIVLFGKRDAFVKIYEMHSKNKSQVQAMQTAFNALPRMVIEVLFVVLFIVTIAVLCVEHESSVQMMGLLGSYLYAGFRLMPGLNRIINQLNCFKSIIPCVEVVHSECNSSWAKETYVNVNNFKFSKDININNLYYRYPNTDKDVLNNINLTIAKGECIGIIGETGSGKSTLSDIILGLLKPHHGTILVDGLYPLNSYQWHNIIGYVPQSIYLVDDSIEANIAFGEKDIDATRVNAAIDSAQLRKFISNLPHGCKTKVGERGVRLSGGERQRIAIARALYRNPEVLIFDEATSALDSDTEARLMETIHSVSKNRTVIMIAHRQTTLKNCNRIIMMENSVIKHVTDYQSLQNIGNPNYA